MSLKLPNIKYNRNTHTLSEVGGKYVKWVVIFLIIGGFRVNLGQYDVINAKEVEAKELVVELTPSLENIAYFTADDADDADGIFNADNTNDDNCDDADDKKNSDEDEEILYDFFDLFLEGVELANEDFETYKSLVWNKNKQTVTWHSCVSGESSFLNLDLGTRLQLGIGFGLFREGGSRGGSGNGSNGDSSGDKSDSNKKVVKVVPMEAFPITKAAYMKVALRTEAILRHQVTQMNIVLEVVTMKAVLIDSRPK
ncbi:hypothetical protein RhiirA5_394193 [Rhizophagus irregularis]|uniref:Uncharacterized protein n=1 Tax=Rhizophagus irregularis TaxID=588596 RepID=A0A2N0QCD6_9GLOM|nr:hypothetical protein RhiirA5_394193 [Rhizophagus irregularis]